MSYDECLEQAAHTLTTPRLELRPTKVNHARQVFELMSDARLWVFFPELRPSSVAALEAQYARWERGGPDPDTGERWENWICFLRADDNPIGSTQATIFPDGSASIAYAVYIPYQRRGFAHEAAEAVIRHLRSHHDVAVVRADMSVANVPSVRVAESLGFSRVRQADGEFVYELDQSKL